MRVLGSMTVTALLACGPVWSDNATPLLRFAWPPGGEAQVELTDERTVGEVSRKIVMTMRLRVEPDGASDRLIVRLSDARLISVDGSTPGDLDPAHTLLAAGSVMKRVTPTMVISREGRYLETRDLDRLVHEVLEAAGFPGPPPGFDAFSHLLDDVAAEDWITWTGAWLGQRLRPGDTLETERELPFDGARIPVRITRRGLTPKASEGYTRLEASTAYPSESVRHYTAGFLIDMAREAKELGDKDPVASMRFLESAQYGPLTQTLTVELETATMRPAFAERTRTFSAVKGKHRVDGRERRTHKFTWVN
jgi:hypothetical protein